MILYKYVNYDSGIAILKNNNIGFRQPKYFNDPAELQASYPTNDYKSISDFLALTNSREFKKIVWSENYAIFSLTRAPNNPLMWSHYGDSHRGFVIGFEVNQEIFVSEKTNLIPVQFGNVIYTATKPIHEFLTKPTDEINIGSEISFKPQQFERLQRVFFIKPMCWSYEEEVRVVKNIFNKNENNEFLSGISNTIKIGGNNLYILQLPKNSIKEIHMGLRNPIYTNQSGELKKLVEVTREHSADIRFYECRQENSSWYIDSLEMLEDFSSILKRG